MIQNYAMRGKITTCNHTYNLKPGNGSLEKYFFFNMIAFAFILKCLIIKNISEVCFT
jgi:hypothetical protein